MSTSTFNAAVDYFGLETSSSNALKVTGSNKNPSKQSTSGANCYGDPTVVDSWGESAAPSADYMVVAALTQAGMPKLGTVITVSGMTGPVVLGGVRISTRSGSAPTLSASGQMVQTGAATLREYTLPAFSLDVRHRAQDFLGLVSIKKGTNAADAIEDYGLESVDAEFPIEITLAQPKGVTMNYDLHGGMATCSYSMNWYASTAPTIELTAAAEALGATISTPVGDSAPEGGYVQYTWTVSFPFTGVEKTVS